MALLKLAVLFATFLTVCANALPTLHAKGAKIFDSGGNQFFIKGIAYQLVPDDPLLDVDQCNRDASLMKTLGTNSIRVYHVDPSQSHDECMAIFANAGIYLWLDLDTFNTQMDEAAPSWNATQFSHFASVMDSFAKYDNLAGFWIGNEVIRTAAGSAAAVYVKAATTDIKAYRDSKSYRKFMIGYSAADIAELRPMLQNYLACGDFASSTEAFGLNSYEWCGPINDFNTSGYSFLQAQAKDYNVPIFFSETGCNVPLGMARSFDDQGSIFGPEMSDTWSGAMVYEWIQEANHYGLISYPNGGVSGEPTPVEPDFSNLKSWWQKVHPSSIKEADYTPSLKAPPCPGPTNGWKVNGNPALPTLGIAAVTKVEYGSSARPTPTRTSPPVTASSGSTSSSVTSAAAAATSSKSAASARELDGRGLAVVVGVVGVVGMIVG